MPQGIAKELVRVLPGWCATTEGRGGQDVGEDPGVKKPFDEK